jgi:hypothetical protein
VGGDKRQASRREVSSNRSRTIASSMQATGLVQKTSPKTLMHNFEGVGGLFRGCTEKESDIYVRHGYPHTCSAKHPEMAP